MHRPNAPISLADLAAAGLRLRPYEAVTLVRELILQVARGEVAGVPSPHVIRLSSSGAVSVEGPVAAGGRPVVRAAQLLESLLPPADAGSQFRVPGGLKLVVARALGTLDLPPFGSLEAFAEALARFAATDSAAAVANLVVSWSDYVANRAPEPVAAPAGPAPAAQVQQFVGARTTDARAHLTRDALTVSDIRRARRATGLPLATVAERSRIPVPLLRQLEWGYLFNWPDGHYGRTQLVRYARAAGLDEQLVVATILPMLQEIDRPAEPAPSQSVALEPARPAALAAAAPLAMTLTRDEPVPVATAAGRRPARLRTAAVAALAVPALLVLALVPIWSARSARPEVVVATQAPAVPAGRSPSPATAAPSGTTGAPAPAPEQAGSGVSPDSNDPANPSSDPAATAAPTESEAPAGATDAGAAASGAAARADVTAPGNVESDETDGGAAAYRLASDRRAFSPSFASVGTAVFYHAEERGRSSLVRADTDDDGAVLRITRIVDDSAQNFHVRPSPDATRIAFDSDRDGVRGVYVADADGKNVRRVSGEGFAAVPSWSPDGSTLAFVREEPGRSKVWNLWTLHLGSGELRQITKHRIGQPWGGSWFPDGRRIAYSHEHRLVIHDLQTGTERAFRTPVKGGWVRTPAVSPDGSRIIFQVHGNGAWLLELGSGAMRRVLEDPTAEEYTWSPDGKRVAYHSRRAGSWGVWVMAPRMASR